MTEWHESDKGRALYGIESKSFLGHSRVADVWADRELQSLLKLHNEPPCWIVEDQ